MSFGTDKIQREVKPRELGMPKPKSQAIINIQQSFHSALF